jgi:recombination protein RecT
MVTTELSQRTAADWLKELEPEMQKVLPKSVTAERMARIVLTEFRKTPRLLECTRESLAGGILTSAQLGLELGGGLGHAWLVPYGRDAVLQIGYRGMIDLAYRSGAIARIEAQLVCSGDEFAVMLGTETKIEHRPALKNRGDVTHVYAVGQIRHGGLMAQVMEAAEVEAIRKRSKAGRSGPWQTDWGEMAKKTCTRRLMKYLPATVLPRSAWDALDREDAALYDPSERVAERTEATAADLRDRLEQAKGKPDGEDEPDVPAAGEPEPSGSSEKPDWWDAPEAAKEADTLPF